MIYITTQTFPPAVGGMENVMFSLAEGLAARGEDVTVLPKLAVEQNNGFAVHHKKLPKPLRNIYKRIYLARHLSPDDFIICDSWKSVAAIPKYYIGKLVVMAYGQEYLKTGKRAKRVQAALNRATHIIPCSQYTMKMIEAGWSVAHAARTVIPPTYMLPNNAPDFKLRKNKPLKVVSLCRLEERKGLRQSLEALATLGDQVPEWTWTLCGSGPQADELALMIVQLGLEGRVIMPGRVDEDAKAELLAEADLFLMPSYQQGKSLEGYGITYAEAARYGTPAIAGIAGGAPEAVINGKTGWCVNTLDAFALQTTIRDALTDANKRHVFGEAARNHFLKNLTGKRCLEAFFAHIGVS
ncbi:MAG: glycosyltransferase family 4 protein [Candidatus Micropelagos thuwalensis]